MGFWDGFGEFVGRVSANIKLTEEAQELLAVADSKTLEAEAHLILRTYLPQKSPEVAQAVVDEIASGIRVMIMLGQTDTDRYQRYRGYSRLVSKLL